MHSTLEIFHIIFYSLVALSFAEFLREGGLYLFRDVRGNYYPISSPFCLINGGLIACSVGKCILSAAYFIARHISTLAHILLFVFCRREGFLLHSFVYFGCGRKEIFLKYLTGNSDSRNFPCLYAGFSFSTNLNFTGQKSK